MKIKELLIAGLVLLSQTLNAQTDYRPGYIITNSADTIYGQIDYRGSLLMGSICKFKSDTGKVVTYSPKDISAYRFVDGKYFISKEVDGNAFFLEYLIKGTVNIYYLRDKKSDRYFIDKDGLKLSEIPYKEGTKYVKNTEYFYNSTLHVGIIKTYMQDAPELFPKIEKMKRPDNHNLTGLAEEYNNLVCKGGQCITYQKRQPLLSVNPEAVTGMTKFGKSYYIRNKSYFSGGVLAHIWMPAVNEKLFLRTGIIYTAGFDYDEKIRIPFQLEYICPTYLIRPKLALGVNFDKSLCHSVAFMGGVNIRISDNILGSISYDIDFTPMDSFPIAPNKLMSQSLSVGIYLIL